MHRGALKDRIKVNCSNCGKELERIPYDVKRAKYLYCNVQCIMEHRDKTDFYRKENSFSWKGGDVKLICPNCSVKFKKSRGQYNFAIKRNYKGMICCSRKCADEYKGITNTNKRRDDRIEFKCKQCDKMFKVYQSQRRGKFAFCSVDCRKKYQIGEKANSWKGGNIELICENCHKTFSVVRYEVISRNRRFCSWNCRNEFMIGENASGWKGGVASFSSVLRNIKECRDWRERIFIRDNGICQKCGIIENIDVHHIEEFSRLVKKYNITSVDKARVCKELWDLSNGICLCVHCHAEEHPDRRKLILRRVS